MSVEQELARIRKAQEATARERSRVEAQIEHQKSIIKGAAQELAELGCNTVEDAKKAIKNYQVRIDEGLEEIRKIL